jgi:hypothetical protein
MDRACRKHGREKLNAYTVSVVKPEVERPLGRPRHVRENNMKMDLKEIEWGGMDWISLTQDMDLWLALVRTVRTLLVP